MSDSSKEFMYCPWYESMSYYRPGGYHPIDLGDIFDDRYEVVLKLAYTSRSTIWLVEDLIAHRFASLRVLSAEASATSSEMRVSEHLKLKAQQDSQLDVGKEHVMQIYDTFTVQGPNGTHHCIISELLAFTLAEEEEALRATQAKWHVFPQDVNKKIAGQVALGLAYLHKCGIIHGDIHLKNVMYYSSALQTLPRDKILKLYGKPRPARVQYELDKSPVPYSVHRPKEVYITGDMNKLFAFCLKQTDNIHIKICDFGESTLQSPEPPTTTPTFHMPKIFQPPEVFFNDITAPTYSMDIWSLGVLLYMIMNHKRPPFYEDDNNLISGAPPSPDWKVIKPMIARLGKLPEKWWARWDERGDYFSESGVDLKCKVQAGTRGKKWLHPVYSRLPEEEVVAFNNMLWKVFRVEQAFRLHYKTRYFTSFKIWSHDVISEDNVRFSVNAMFASPSRFFTFPSSPSVLL